MGGIEKQLAAAGIVSPDLIFDMDVFDPTLRKEQGIEVPEAIRERSLNGKQQFRSGVYLIYSAADESLWYVGKARRMRNRLQAHFVGRGSDVLDRAAEDSPLDFCPFVAVWLREPLESVELEVRLIRALNPRYNTQERDMGK